jgi:hypothetical protein
VRGVKVHIRHDSGEYDGKCDVDKMSVFHGWLDGGNGLWGDLLLASCFGFPGLKPLSFLGLVQWAEAHC